MRRVIAVLSFACLAAAAPRPALAWYDATHQAVLAAAGAPFSPCLAVAADVLAHKLPRESHNHFSNLAGSPDAAGVRAEAARYDTWDPAGHLNGAVLAALGRVREQAAAGRRVDYEFGFLAHYVGDLSQPLHQSPYDAFNHAHHREIDGIVDARPDLVAAIKARMRPCVLADEDAVVAAIAQVAARARAADVVLRASGLDEDAALTLLAGSATLLRALAVHAGIAVD